MFEAEPVLVNTLYIDPAVKERQETALPQATPIDMKIQHSNVRVVAHASDKTEPEPVHANIDWPTEYEV